MTHRKRHTISVKASSASKWRAVKQFADSEIADRYANGLAYESVKVELRDYNPERRAEDARGRQRSVGVSQAPCSRRLAREEKADV